MQLGCANVIKSSISLYAESSFGFIQFYHFTACLCVKLVPFSHYCFMDFLASVMHVGTCGCLIIEYECILINLQTNLV